MCRNYTVGRESAYYNRRELDRLLEGICPDCQRRFASWVDYHPIAWAAHEADMTKYSAIADPIPVVTPSELRFGFCPWDRKAWRREDDEVWEIHDVCQGILAEQTKRLVEQEAGVV